jgi:enoyl-CoA hydratase/carnithine racemase
MAEALDRLEALPIPTIAAIEGPALGGGAEIAVACDIRIMAEAATLGMMHVRLGITPAWGGGQRLLRLTGYARALEWLTMGRVLTAQEAFSYGLANRVVGKGQAMAEASAVAQSIIANDPASVQAAKRLLRAGILLAPEGAAKAERAEFPDLWAAPAHLAASSAFLASRNHRPVPR